MKSEILICLAFVLLIFCFPVTAYAHGAQIDYTSEVAIDLVATYDNGEAMAEAQVVVYAPNDPSTPWLKGTCDEEGRFTFVPDVSMPGIWDIQVRQAGHGDMVHITIAEGTMIGESSSGYSIGQIVLMSVCVVWGIIGTALFFRWRQS
ncbi:MAG: carboxypeptidase regulatory-like domain-containing protein [Chloroflexota bacterium]|nr:carboxypeptidase regulatory-like domain-containing protein [Chloroflexota bacterium]